MPAVELSALGEQEKIRIMQSLAEKPMFTMEGTGVYARHPSEFSAELFKGKPVQVAEFLSQMLLSPDGLDSDRMASYVGEAITFVSELNSATIKNLETALAKGTSWGAASKISSVLAEQYYSENDATGILTLLTNSGANRLAVFSSLASTVRLSPTNALCASEAAFLGTEDKNPEVRYAALTLLMEVVPSLDKKGTNRFLETLQRLVKDRDKLVSHVAGEKLEVLSPRLKEVPPTVPLHAVAKEVPVSPTQTVVTAAGRKKPVRVVAHSSAVVNVAVPAKEAPRLSLRDFSSNDFPSSGKPKFDTSPRLQKRA